MYVSLRDSWGEDVRDSIKGMNVPVLAHQQELAERQSNHGDFSLFSDVGFCAFGGSLVRPGDGQQALRILSQERVMCDKRLTLSLSKS
jgi:hypothetical protein